MNESVKNSKVSVRSVSAHCRWVAIAAFLIMPVAFAYQVSVGTYVANAGKVVTVPVVLDSAAGLSYAGATLAYDPRVLVVRRPRRGRSSR